MLRFPYFRFCYVLVTTYPALQPGRLLFWSNIITYISVMIAVNKSERKTLLEWHSCKSSHHIIPLPWFSPSLYPPPNRGEKKHILYLLLNCLTSSMAGTKSRRETCILKRSFAQSSFIMYIYANDILDYSRKSPSLLLLLPFGQSFRPAICTESGSRQRPWLVFFTKTI